MRYVLAVSGLCVVVLLAATVPLFAHHSFAAEYDNNKPIKFTGKVNNNNDFIEFLRQRHLRRDNS